MLEAVVSLLQVAAVVASFIAIPVGARRIFPLAVMQFGLKEFHQVPLLQKLNVTAGAILGFLAVYHFGERRFGERSIFHPQEIFEPAGPWDLTFLEFVVLRAARFALELRFIVVSVFTEPGSNSASIFGMVAIGLVAAAGVTSFLIWPPLRASAAVLVCIISALIVGFTIFYLTVGLFWLSNLLGPFIFVLPILILRPPVRFIHGK